MASIRDEVQRAREGQPIYDRPPAYEAKIVSENKADHNKELGTTEALRPNFNASFPEMPRDTDFEEDDLTIELALSYEESAMIVKGIVDTGIPGLETFLVQGQLISAT